MSMPNTRLSRCAQAIPVRRTGGELGGVWAVAPLPRPALVTCARCALSGANTPCKRVRWTRGLGTNAARRAMKSSVSKSTCVVPSRYGVLSWYRTCPPRGERQALFRHRRATDIPAQPLELPAFISPRRHAGVQAEAADLAWRRSGRFITGRQGLQREDLPSGARPHRDAVGDRVREQGLHRLRVEGELGKARAFGIALEQTLAFQKTAHAAGDVLRERAELGARGRLHPAERERALGALGALDVHPVEERHVEVHVEVERPPKRWISVTAPVRARFALKPALQARYVAMTR
jgi:hypothetical protein